MFTIVFIEPSNLLTFRILINPPAWAKPRGGFLNPADLLSVVGVRKWPLGNWVHLDTFY